MKWHLVYRCLNSIVRAASGAVLTVQYGSIPLKQSTIGERYILNFECFWYFLSLICNSAVECVTGGDEYSNQLAKEIDTLKVSKFISLKVNGKGINLDNTDFGEDFYNDIVDKMTDGEISAGES